MEPTDEELIAACRNGSQDAWETLVRRYRRLIFAIPRRAGFDEDVASDVFQQVFAILVKNIDRIQQPSQIHAWLVTTARRETIRLIRLNKERQLRNAYGDEETLDLAASIPDKSPLADEVLLGLETQNRVRIAVESLDERCRRLLEMLFYRNSPPAYADIAAELGISEGSIGPTRARCLQKAMTRLGN